MSIDVSVVVPVYGVEKYLPRCLASLEAQTAFDRAEILLVDDGSVDASGQICDAFARRHANVRVIHKQNGGVSSARNAGLDAAVGAAIAFVDADDSLRPEALEIALNGLERGADAVFFRYVEGAEDELIARADAAQELWFEGEQVYRAVLEHREGLMENVFKVLRADAARSARFPEDMCCGEDAVYLFNVLKRVRRALMPAQYLYFYCVRPGSIMRTLRPEVLDQRVRAHDEVTRLTREAWPEVGDLAEARALYMRLYVLNDMLDNPDTSDAACFRRHVRALRRHLPKLLRLRQARWLPPARKVYALLLAVCPPLAKSLHRRRRETA